MSELPLHIRGARVLDAHADPDKPAARDILIADGRISAIFDPDAADAPPTPPGAVEIDARGRLAIPGLVNAHYHSYDTLSKGRFEDMPFDVWALHSQPGPWGPRGRAELRVRTLLGALECLRNGITTVQDMNALVPQDEATLDAILDAYAEAGIRVVFSIAVRDLPAPDIAPFLPGDTPPSARARLEGKRGDPAADLAFVTAQLDRYGDARRRLHWALGPSGPQRCSRALLEGIAELSRARGLPVLTHLYETRAQLAKARATYPDHGGSLIRYAADVGLLTPRTSFAHGVYLTEAEIDALAAAGAGVVHNPVANLKLKNGVAPLLAFKKAGVNLALGCDNCSCGDCQNMFQAMKLYALLAAGSSGSPGGVLARDALAAATVGGARALGLADRIGALAPGMAADLVLIDLADYAYQPLNGAVRQLVYAESGRGVDTVIVDGEIVVERGRNRRVDEAAFREELAGLMRVCDADYAALARRQAPVVPYLLAAQREVDSLALGLDRFVAWRAPGADPAESTEIRSDAGSTRPARRRRRRR
jgi:5-methylthioadenosine/S-adenosylhomocysteine deaminase